MASITVNYNLKDAGYQNYANQKLRFTLLGAGAKASTDFVVARGFVTSTSDANGDGSVTLYRSAESGVANNIYEILLPGNERVNVITPDSSSIELADLIVNHRVQTSTPEITGINVASVTATTCDLNGGTIDGTVIGGSTAAAGTFTSIDVSDGNITNAGDINCDSISVDAAANGLDINFGGNTGTNKITLADNLADSLNVTEGSNSYLKFITTNSSEQIVFGKNSTFASTTIADLGTVTTANIDGGTIDATVIGASTKAAVTGTNVLASTSIGYTTGNGGTVSQSTSKSTSVTLDKTSGKITMNSASLAHDTNVQFTLSNDQIASTDVVIVNVKNCIGASSEYLVGVTTVSAGSCEIMLRNISNDNSAKSDAVQLSFAVIKSVES
jgi:hypothetical protein|tara:strand:- start:374 stop:1531 length:1158 start_codon:yes stop_codon:yes gene_type:complete